MANEDLGKLSPEQVKQLANTISEAKNLTGQQEEIIKKVLAGETEIGTVRISLLEKYFDTYSKNLDIVARKHSTLNDSFLILDKKIADNYKTLSSNITNLEKQLAGLTSTDKSSKSSKDTKRSKNDNNSESPTDDNAKSESSTASKQQLDLIVSLLSDNKKLVENIYHSTINSTTTQDRLLNDICKLIYEQASPTKAIDNRSSSGGVTALSQKEPAGLPASWVALNESPDSETTATSAKQIELIAEIFNDLKELIKYHTPEVEQRDT